MGYPNQKITLGTLFILLSFMGCADSPKNTGPAQLRWISYPVQVTTAEPFTVVGEYLAIDSVNSEIKISLTIREIDSNRGLISTEQTINNQSQNVTFANIKLNEINNNIYFELTLIKNGLFNLSINTHSTPTQTANWHTNITTTYFGPTGTSTWGKTLATENPYYCALPYRDFYYYVWNSNTGQKELKKQDYYGIADVKNRWIKITNPATMISAYAQWEDVGPWNYYDPYYVFSNDDKRPYAEIGIDMGWSSYGYRETNRAGLDLSPDVMRYLNNGTLTGKITVNWKFVLATEVPAGPWSNNISTSSADPLVLNLMTESLRTWNH